MDYYEVDEFCVVLTSPPNLLSQGEEEHGSNNVK